MKVLGQNNLIKLSDHASSKRNVCLFYVWILSQCTATILDYIRLKLFEIP